MSLKIKFINEFTVFRNNKNSIVPNLVMLFFELLFIFVILIVLIMSDHDINFISWSKMVISEQIIISLKIVILTMLFVI